MKHTPGPWKTEEHDHRFTIVAPWSETLRAGSSNTFGSYLGAHICEIEYCSSENAVPTRDQAEANARLIAAAPDLLAALKWMTALLNDPCHDADEMDGWKVQCKHWTANARAAIAKATP